jgi:hypothetical protein
MANRSSTSASLAGFFIALACLAAVVFVFHSQTLGGGNMIFVADTENSNTP